VPSVPRTPARPGATLGIFTGLRAGEIGSLPWRHVDLAADWLIFSGKGGRPDRVALPHQLSDALARWQDRVITEVGPAIAEVPVALALRASNRPGAHVVPVRHTGFGREGVHRIVRACGIQIVPVQDIRLVLRHHHVATTQTYLADNPLRVHERMRSFTIG
jgi:integrase